MTHDEARALIAAGRMHDEAMSAGEWFQNRDALDAVYRMVEAEPLGPMAVCAWPVDARGIAWMHNNLARLLDGYAEALAEIERLRSRAGASAAGRRRCKDKRIAALEIGLREACNWIADRSPDGSILVDRLRAVADGLQSQGAT